MDACIDFFSFLILETKAFGLSVPLLITSFLKRSILNPGEMGNATRKPAFWYY